MAKLNYSESAPLASGKIGGQQIIKNRHGVILQSISQPPSFGTIEQKKQRFVTNTLAQKWKQLTALQKQSFADSATTWFKKSKSGQLINQSPYGLFLFLQQNSALIGEDGPLFGVDYQSLIEPQAYLVSKSQTSIIVKSDNTVNDYEYLVFIDPRTTDFRVSQLNSELLVGRLTALELDQGFDIAPIIQSHYDFPVNMSKVSTRLSAVEMGTGRRSEEIRWLFKIGANFIVQGLSISTPAALAIELNIPESRIHDFSYNSSDNITEASITGNYNIRNGQYTGNNNLLSYYSTTGGTLGNFNVFRSCNQVKEIIIPNKTNNNVNVNNQYNIGCQLLTKLDISSVIRLQHNFINPSPQLVELHIKSVEVMDTYCIRGVPKLDLIDAKKCKYLALNPHTPNDYIFTGLKSTVTINWNAFLLTSDDGDIDPMVLRTKNQFPNSTINFYDDNGVLVHTL